MLKDHLVCSSVTQLFVLGPASHCERPAEDRGVRVTGLPGNNQRMFPDHILTFSCDAGKHLTGSSVLICGTDGQWNSQFPSCQGKDCESTEGLS